MPDQMSDPIRDVLQQVLDDWGDGWTVNSFVIGMNLERVEDDDELVACKWLYIPPGQHQDFTDGLVTYLIDATETRYCDDDD